MWLSRHYYKFSNNNVEKYKLKKPTHIWHFMNDEFKTENRDSKLPKNIFDAELAQSVASLNPKQDELEWRNWALQHDLYLQQSLKYPLHPHTHPPTLKDFLWKTNLIGKFKIFKVMWILAKICKAIVSCSYLIASKGN